MEACGGGGLLAKVIGKRMGRWLSTVVVVVVREGGGRRGQGCQQCCWWWWKRGRCACQRCMALDDAADVRCRLLQTALAHGSTARQHVAACNVCSSHTQHAAHLNWHSVSGLPFCMGGASGSASGGGRMCLYLP